jgi:Lrp/AsnC family transcriptional regulator, regulator for asnA, asnC and gidA
VIEELDELDLRLISILTKDASQSSIKLARILNVSPQTVRRRVETLVKNQIINIRVIQYYSESAIKVIIGLRVERNLISQTLELLIKRGEVKFLASVSGRYNIIVWAKFESIASYSAFLDEIIYPLKPLQEPLISICTQVRRFAFFDQPDQIERYAKKKLDSIDRRIIHALDKNATQNSTNLARQLNISAPTVRHRINNLLDKYIRIQAIPNLHLGRTVTAVIGITVEKGSLNRVVDLLMKREEVWLLGLFAGPFDIGIWAIFKSTEEFTLFLNGVLNPLEDIREKEILLCTKIHKLILHN